MNKFYIFFIILCSFFFTSCHDKSWEDEFEKLQSELDIQKELIAILQQNIAVKNITESSNGYTVTFSNGSSIFLSKAKNPHITTIGENGNWFVNGKDSKKTANVNIYEDENETFFIEIGINGNWYINNEDISIKANDALSDKDFPIIIDIIQTYNYFYFFFSDKTIIKIKRQIKNFIPNHNCRPLPSNTQSLKILAIGNSFTEDAFDFLPDLIQSAKIKNITIAQLIHGGSSLKDHYKCYQENSATYYFLVRSDQGAFVAQSYTLQQAITYTDWDIVVLQQLSCDAGRYQTYQPYLDNLTCAIKLNCKNAGVVLAWQMTWAYGSQCTFVGFNYYNRNQKKMYKAIVETNKILLANTDIDIIIPSGTAIQNLRNTSLNNPPLEITRDNQHIDLGAGRYTLACTWFQTLIAPCFHTSIAGNSFRTAHGNIPVTNDNYRICQQAAQYACIRPYVISTISEE